MKWLDDQKAHYGSLGPARFFGLYGALLIYIFVFVWLLTWLSDETGWPEAYGSQCHGRGCWPTYLWHSFGLLKNSTGYQIGLFALLWHVPAAVILTIVIVLGRRRMNKRRNRIRPMRDDYP